MFSALNSATVQMCCSLKKRMGKFWWHSAVLFCASRLGDAANIIIGLFLVPMFVPEDQLGAVIPLLQLGAFVSVPVTAAAQTTARYLTEFRVAGEFGRIRSILKDLIILSFLLAIIGVIVLVVGRPFFIARLRFEGVFIPFLVSGIVIVSCWRPVLALVNQGLGNYYLISVSVMVAGLSRIVLASLLIPFFALQGYLAMQLVSGLIVCIFLMSAFRVYFVPEVMVVSNRALLSKISKYFLPMLFTTAIVAFQALLEPWIIRHRLPAMESAAYYIGSRFGMIPTYIGGSFGFFLFPMASEIHDKTQSTRRLQLQSIGAMLGVGFFLTGFFFFFGELLLNQFESWRTYTKYSDLLWLTSLIAVGQSIISIYIVHEAACRRFGFLWVLVPVILLEVVGLYCLMGWTFFQDIIPSGIWLTVDGFVVQDISFVILFMLLARGMIITIFLLKEIILTKLYRFSQTR